MITIESLKRCREIAVGAGEGKTGSTRESLQLRAAIADCAIAICERLDKANELSEKAIAMAGERWDSAKARVDRAINEAVSKL